MDETRKLRVFLSYAHTDIEPVRKLYHELSDKGFEVWFDEESLIPGQEWKSEIEKALENSDAVVVCLSNNSVSKEGFVQREFKFALDKALEMTEDGIFLIPVRLEECKVPSKLSRYHWVDLFTDNGLNRLMKALLLRTSQVTQRHNLEPKKKETFDLPQVQSDKNKKGVSQDEKTPQDNLFSDINTPNLKLDKSTPPIKPNTTKTNHVANTTTFVRSNLNVSLLKKWLLACTPAFLALPALFIIKNFAVGKNIADSTLVIEFFLVLSAGIIISATLQWLILRKLFPSASRWIALNSLFIPSAVVTMLAGFSVVLTYENIFFIVVFILVFWLGLVLYTGLLVSQENQIVKDYFSLKTKFNITFCIKWIGCWFSGALVSIISNQGNPVALGLLLIGIIGFIQGLLIRDVFRTWWIWSLVNIIIIATAGFFFNIQPYYEQFFIGWSAWDSSLGLVIVIGISKIRKKSYPLQTQ